MILTNTLVEFALTGVVATRLTTAAVEAAPVVRLIVLPEPPLIVYELALAPERVGVRVNGRVLLEYEQM